LINQETECRCRTEKLQRRGGAEGGKVRAVVTAGFAAPPAGAVRERSKEMQERSLGKPG
jgi:hypothetical protein